MRKRRILVCLMISLILCLGFTVPVSANEKSTNNQNENTISPKAIVTNGVCVINGKKYSCSARMLYTTETSQKHHVGMTTNCAANTSREMKILKITANTAHDGYITKSGTIRMSGINELKYKKIVSFFYELDTPNYKNLNATCTIFYGGEQKWLGILY